MSKARRNFYRLISVAVVTVVGCGIFYGTVHLMVLVCKGLGY